MNRLYEVTMESDKRQYAQYGKPIIRYNSFEYKVGSLEHSEWFDLLAKFGLFSIFLMVYLFRPKKVYKGNQGFKLAFIFLLILGMLNPVHFFNIYFIVFFYIPLVDDYLFADQPPGLSKSTVRRVSVQTQGVKN